MKLSTRDISILKILGIVVLIALIIVAMFYPELINNPYSIKDIENKQEEVFTLNQSITSNDAMISSEASRLDSLRSETKLLESDYNRVQAGIGETDFKLHIPSVLITLEQLAKENEVELELDYAGIQTHEGTSPGERHHEHPDEFDNEYHEEYDEHPEDDYYEEEYDELEDELGEGGDEILKDEDLNLDGGSSVASLLPEQHTDFSMDEIQYNIPSIAGVNITTVKINLNGTYESIRNYIFEVDGIDFIEHNVIDLLSYGNSVSAVIVLNIYHTADGGGIN